MQVKDLAQRFSTRMIGLRHEFHQYPEVSFAEHRTGQRIAEVLESLGITVQKGVGKTGVVGILKGAKDGPTIALRGDIDALPIQEMNEIPYRSKVPGVMHACGHDVHITSVLGAAMILTELRNEIKGSVKFIFQPAEEKNAGAKMMLEDGVLENPRVDAIFGLHNHPALKVGTIGVKEGPLMAAVDTIFIDVFGDGGHGAIPHRTIDPIVAGSAIVMGLQTAVSRNTDPLEPAVVSIGTFQAGTANNIIPDKVEMSGTVRTFNPALREAMPETLERIVEGIAAGYKARAELRYRPDLPPVLNDPVLTSLGRATVEKILGPGGAVFPTPSMGGEDFAIFQERVPGCFFWLGVGNPDKGITHQWHNPRYDADDDSLSIGAAILAQSALDAADYLLKSKIEEARG